MKPLDSLHDNDRNRDPLTGTSGSHPVGTGVGAVAGGIAAGAAAGTVVGPVGTAVGAAAGAVVGALAGKGLAEAIDPTAEDAYWRDHYGNRPYVESGFTYEDYGPAYGLGVEVLSRHPDRSFDDMEPELSERWATDHGSSNLSWERARTAARDAWNRIRPGR